MKLLRWLLLFGLATPLFAQNVRWDLPVTTVQAQGGNLLPVYAIPGAGAAALATPIVHPLKTAESMGTLLKAGMGDTGGARALQNEKNAQRLAPARRQQIEARSLRGNK